jgi:drug/metabolite transporter (DMT)-like permease
MQFFINHFYIFLSISFAVASQLITKWQMSKVVIEETMSIFDKLLFAFYMLINPYILLSIFLTLLSGLSWMIVMSKFDISYAYPYTALGFGFVLFFSYILFNESISIYKLLGVSLIMFGIFIISKDMQ